MFGDTKKRYSLEPLVREMLMSESRVERSQLPPVAWFFILVFGFLGATAVVLRISGAFSDPDVWKDLVVSLVQCCFVASLVCYFSAGRVTESGVSREIRDRAADRAALASHKGIPWYIAPVFWVPISMLSIIWYFPG